RVPGTPGQVPVPNLDPRLGAVAFFTINGDVATASGTLEGELDLATGRNNDLLPFAVLLEDEPHPTNRAIIKRVGEVIDQVLPLIVGVLQCRPVRVVGRQLVQNTVDEGQDAFGFRFGVFEPTSVVILSAVDCGLVVIPGHEPGDLLVQIGRAVAITPSAATASGR